MWTFSIAFILALASSVWCQDCSGPPRYGVRPMQCCPNMPCVITRELATECGLPIPGEGNPPGPPSCEAMQCALRKNNLLTGDKVNRSVFKTYLESKSSSEWLPVVERATQACNNEISASVTGCEPRQYMGCIKDKLFLNCPSLVASDPCNSLKAHIQNCPKPNGPMT